MVIFLNLTLVANIAKENTTLYGSKFDEVIPGP